MGRGGRISGGVRPRRAGKSWKFWRCICDTRPPATATLRSCAGRARELWGRASGGACECGSCWSANQNQRSWCELAARSGFRVVRHARPREWLSVIESQSTSKVSHPPARGGGIESTRGPSLSLRRRGALGRGETARLACGRTQRGWAPPRPSWRGPSHAEVLVPLRGTATQHFRALRPQIEQRQQLVCPKRRGRPGFLQVMHRAA